ncbi:hypothetical protein GCM10022254_43150 [Actinomadura meridiana]|uniref:Transposase n=1 Tax=Actinomadura meridiana TaxID=559626 RepID=A0ABP8C937_9ACTN
MGRLTPQKVGGLLRRQRLRQWRHRDGESVLECFHHLTENPMELCGEFDPIPWGGAREEVARFEMSASRLFVRLTASMISPLARIAIDCVSFV